MDRKELEPVDSVDKLKARIRLVREAAKIYAAYTEEQVDRIFLAAATAANKARVPLAKLAVEETGMGVVEDKVIKNHFASEYISTLIKTSKRAASLRKTSPTASKRSRNRSVSSRP